MKPMLSIFQYAIKFEYRFLAMIQFSFWFMSFIFDKLAPLNERFKICFESFFETI